MLTMRRLTNALVLLAAVIAMNSLATDAQITFDSMQKRRSRVRGSKRSIDGDDDASRSSAKATQLGVGGGGYSFADLAVSSDAAGTSGGSTQKQSVSTVATTSTASNDTAVKPLGKSQAAGVPLTPEVTTYSKDSDPKQSEPETASPTPSKAVTRTPASASLGKSPVAAVPMTPTPTEPSDNTDPTQSDLETPSPAKTPATTSLGESQVAGHPVVSTPAPTPATDDDGDDEDEDQGSEDDEDGTPKPNTDDASSPKQSGV